MRTDVQLLKVLLDKLNSASYFTGLCYLIAFGPFSLVESERLLDIIHENRPSFKNRPAHLEGSAYWWPLGYKAPRAEFLEQLISKYEARP